MFVFLVLREESGDGPGAESVGGDGAAFAGCVAVLVGVVAGGGDPGLAVVEAGGSPDDFLVVGSEDEGPFAYGAAECS
jgi:hypothetical protein